MYKELDEQELARYCSQRDRLAENELYRRYAVRVDALCRRYLGDEEDAKDLMLETLIQALDRIDTYKYAGKGSLYAWISRIAVNKAINHIIRQRWRTVRLDLWPQDNIPEPTEDEMDTVPKEKLQEWIAGLPVSFVATPATGYDCRASGLEKGRLQYVLHRWLLP